MSKVIKNLVLGMVLLSSTFIGCSTNTIGTTSKDNDVYDGRVFYEIFVRAFNDSDGNGTGDLNGVTEKLDYLKDLGVGGIWLMPINESPSYHGYDVIDYKAINSDYGTMDDFKTLLEEAHKRDIKIYIDMVINHSSTENTWFKEASSSIDNEFRDYYLWTDDESKTSEISEMNTKPWTKNEATNDYYYSIFSSSMPDLNLDNEDVKNELKDIAKFYIDMGVDGFRMDAVKWYFNEVEPNIEFLDEYSSYCKSLNEDFKLLGEVWDTPYAMAEYQTSLDSFFDFELGKLVNKAIQGRNLETLPELIKNNYELYTEENEDFVVAPFLSNHDQNRIMNTLLNDEDKMKMAATIYLTLPGTPFIYYGEETGMTGVKPDEYIRQSFIWSNTDLSENTTWIDSKNNIDKVALNVQENDENSIYNFYKTLISIRNENKSLSHGTIDSIETENMSTMVMKREYNNETSYVIINSGKEATNITLEKGKYKTLLSTTNKEETLNVKDTITIEANEILILLKN